MTKFSPEDQPRRRTVEDKIDQSKTCSYRFRGEICNLPASMSHGTKGEGPWFCRGHFRGVLPEATPGGHWADQLIDTLTKPSDYRQPGESKTAYRERMLAAVKSGLGKVGQPLPYDKRGRFPGDEERAAIMWEGS